MKLKRAQVTNYKSIDDSGWVRFDDVTCLVGKNESGKTAFLKALLKLSPIDGVSGSFDPVMDYPRKNYLRHKSQLEGNNSPIIVRAEFELSEGEVAEIEQAFGSGVLKSNSVMAEKSYNNTRIWQVDCDEEAVVASLIAGADLSSDVTAQLTTSSMEAFINSLKTVSDRPPSAERLLQSVEAQFATSLNQKIIASYLEKFIPRFFYFDDYSTMHGNITIGELKERSEKGNLTDSDRTFLALLGIVGADLDDFDSQDSYERLKAELEAASIGISDEVFRFWTQNKQLEVEFDISTTANPGIQIRNQVNQIVQDTKGSQENTLHVRIKNNRHRVTVPFDERSRGFVWFFSFLAYFSQLEADGGGSLILLLDEPGLSLHAKAQSDFLRFIDERLAPKHQVAYSTHSPFLIDATKLERVRTVQDKDNLGTVIESDVLRPDRDTIFPIQAALGYELSQTLFVGPSNLLVEGPSDLIYLQILSEAVIARGDAGLDPRWTIVPVGGASKLSTFVSLLGANQGLTVAVLMDVSAKDRQVVDNLIANSLLQKSNLVQISEVTATDDADIEDLFDPTFYLEIVSRTYSKDLSEASITVSDLYGDGTRIIKKLELYFKQKNIGGHGKFSHYRPSSYLLSHQGELISQVDNASLDRADALFKRLNALLI